MGFIYERAQIDKEVGLDSKIFKIGFKKLLTI